MYADRHATSSTFDPRFLGIAVALNGAAVAALLLAQPVFTVIPHDKPFHTYQVTIPPPPKPLPADPAERHVAQHRTTVAQRPVIDNHTAPTFPVTDVILPPLPPIGDSGPVTGPTATPTPTPLATIAPEVDPAHRADLQPTYPANELRAERQGSVVVRVLVGTDGRVHQVEQVSATSDAFFRATRERALSRWRFRPAMRGGVPVEAWRTMTIRFVIPG